MNRSIPLERCWVSSCWARRLPDAATGAAGRRSSRRWASEITVSQLSQALHATGLDNPGAARRRGEAVDSLINEQILVDSAMKSELDRDPAVVQALERARRQVLARAYVERMVFPTETDQRGRAGGLLQEASGAVRASQDVPGDDVLGEGRRCHGRAAQRARVAAERRTRSTRRSAAKGVAHDTQSLTRGSEQLPFEDLPRFTAAKVGDLVFLQPHESRMAIMLIQGIHESPIGVDRAQPIIQQYLVNTRNARALEEHMKQARAALKIAYFDTVTAAAADTTANQLAGRGRR